jgi:hypothetical protein
MVILLLTGPQLAIYVAAVPNYTIEPNVSLHHFTRALQAFVAG